MRTVMTVEKRDTIMEGTKMMMKRRERIIVLLLINQICDKNLCKISVASPPGGRSLYNAVLNGTNVWRKVKQ